MTFRATAVGTVHEPTLRCPNCNHEIPLADQLFGLTELRETHLKDGTSDWLAWASACGSRVEKKAARNYSLKYFKNASPINKLIGEVIADLPQP
ncbi:hypothetical protein ABIF64_003099 [Bradyrhizobium japonicum]